MADAAHLVARGVLAKRADGTVDAAAATAALARAVLAVSHDRVVARLVEANLPEGCLEDDGDVAMLNAVVESPEARLRVLVVRGARAVIEDELVEWLAQM